MRLPPSMTSQLSASPGLSLRSLLRWISASKILLPTLPQSSVKVSIGSQLLLSVALATVIVPAAPAGIDAKASAESAAAVRRIPSLAVIVQAPSVDKHAFSRPWLPPRLLRGHRWQQSARARPSGSGGLPVDRRRRAPRSESHR